MARVWTQADQDISDKKLYFVLSIYIPWATAKREAKHLWGPAPYHRARKRRQEIIDEFNRDHTPAKGDLMVSVIRWRGSI